MELLECFEHGCRLFGSQDASFRPVAGARSARLSMTTESGRPPRSPATAARLGQALVAREVVGHHGQRVAAKGRSTSVAGSSFITSTNTSSAAASAERCSSGRCSALNSAARPLPACAPVSSIDAGTRE
jgi:hypothetical protein